MPTRGTLILVCGLPGSGKTTLAKRLEAERNAIRMCPDDWIEAVLADPADTAERDRLRDPIENLQWDLTLRLLEQGYAVVLENGFWSKEERDLYAMGALELGARIELHALDAPEEVLWKRIEARNGTLARVTFVMSREDLADCFRLFEPPTEEELAFYDDGSLVGRG